MILLIDNYDSFTYNLYQYVLQLGEEVTILRNDQTTIEEIKRLNPDYLLLSPGPGNPDDAGICLEAVKEFYRSIPILGICLGHQVIAQAFGGKVIKAKQPMHGKISSIKHDGNTIFRNINGPFQVTRYHSLIVDAASLPVDLEASAMTELGEIMAIRHKDYKVEGVQFHPEAILSEHGLLLLKNFFQGSENPYLSHSYEENKYEQL